MVELRRIILLALCLMLVIGLTFFEKTSLSEVSFDSGDYYFVYINHKNYLPTSGVQVIDNGQGLILKTSFSNAKELRSKVTGVLGEAVETSTYSSEQIINMLQAKKVSQENLQDALVILAYSNKLDGFLSVNNVHVNVQIAVKQDSVIVGYPLILHSF